MDPNQEIAEQTGREIALALGNAMINGIRARAEADTTARWLAEAHQTLDAMNLELVRLRHAADAAETLTGGHEAP